MTTILVVDDDPQKRQSVVTELSDRYKVAEADHEIPALRAIRTQHPSVILINKLSASLNPVSLFFKIKHGYRQTAVLLYALNSSDSGNTLSQIISMALREIRFMRHGKNNQVTL